MGLAEPAPRGRWLARSQTEDRTRRVSVEIGGDGAVIRIAGLWRSALDRPRGRLRRRRARGVRLGTVQPARQPGRADRPLVIARGVERDIVVAPAAAPAGGLGAPAARGSAAVQLGVGRRHAVARCADAAVRDHAGQSRRRSELGMGARQAARVARWLEATCACPKSNLTATAPIPAGVHFVSLVTEDDP